MSDVQKDASSSSSPLPSAQAREIFDVPSDDEQRSSPDQSEYETQPQQEKDSSSKKQHCVTVPPAHGNDSEDELLSTLSARPNKYHGPASTWRSWTAADRSISTSLDRTRAQDLSIHLYNAYALKKRCRTLRNVDGKSPVQGQVWAPPKVWTAWPMGVDEVPRAGEGVWDEEDDWWSKRGKSVSEELEEVLSGIVLKEARERFLAREWESDSDRGRVRSEGAPRSTKRVSRTSRNHRRRSENASEHEEVNYLHEASDSEASHTDHNPSTGFSPSPAPDDLISPTLSSEPSSQEHEPKRPSIGQPTVSPHLKPTILADDALATHILHPSIRHVLSKLDTLLAALHRARLSALRPLDDSQSETQTSADERRSASRNRTPSRVQGRKRGKRERVDASEGAEASAEAELAREDRAGESRARKRSRRSLTPGSRARILQDRQGRMGLRDWSDVLGMAALVGWDAGAVEKAAGRCAALFGEGMDFRVFGAGGELEREIKCQPMGTVEVKESETGEMEDEREVGDEEEMIGGVHVDGFLRPIKARKGWRGRDKKDRKSRKGKHKRRSVEEGSESV